MRTTLLIVCFALLSGGVLNADQNAVATSAIDRVANIVTGRPASPSPITVDLKGARPPAGRWGGETCDTAQEILSLPFSDYGNTCPWQDDYDEACPYGGSSSPDLVYSYHAADTITVDISLCGDSGYDTKLYVYENNCTLGTALACNDDYCSTPSYPYEYVSAILALTLRAGNNYYFVVDGYGGDCGYFTIDVNETIPPPNCPAASLYGQPPHMPADPWSAGASEATVLGTNFLRAERFTNVSGEILGVQWWGLQLVLDEFGSWVPCTETEPLFAINFYSDGGAPGAAVCTYTVPATISPIGLHYSVLGYELSQYTAELPAGCTLRNGWVSIQGLGLPDCWFMWMSSATGDGSSYFTADGIPEPYPYDLSLCLTGTYIPVYGACCDDELVECRDDVELITCIGASLRFFEGGTCAQLEPPCGELPGACCYDDGNCALTTRAECQLTGGIWLGAYTDCSQCPCIVQCGPEAWEEPEPCGAATDNGCNSQPAMFAPIECGTPVCGTIWSTEQMRDTDWYEVTVTERARFTFTVRPEFDAVFGLLEQMIPGLPGCDNMTGVVTPFAVAGGCEAGHIITDCLPPGTYYFFVSTADWIALPCLIGNDYFALLSCETPCFLPTGACCYPDTHCDIATAGDCQGVGGRYYGDDTTCAEVDCPSVPENDDCPNAIPVGEAIDLPFDTFAATFDGSGLCVVGFAGGNIWYCYTPSCTGDIIVDLCGSQFDTLLAVYDGCDCIDFNILGCNDDDWNRCGGPQSAIAFQGIAGRQYLIEVAGLFGSTGQGDLTITCTPGQLGACCLDGVCIGDLVEIECRAFHGAWRGDATCDTFQCPPPAAGDNCSRPIAVVVNAGTLPYADWNTTCGHGNDYAHTTCLNPFDLGEDIIYQLTLPRDMCLDIAVNSTAGIGFAIDTACPPGRSCLAYTFEGYGNPQIIGLNLAAGVYYLMVDTMPPPFCADYTLSIAECPPPPAGDECDQPLCVQDGVEVFATNVRAGGEDITSCGWMDFNDIWFLYIPLVSGPVIVDTIGTSFDSTLAAFDTCGGSELVCNDDYWGVQSQITLDMTAGQPYLLRVAGYNAESGTIVLHATGGQGRCRGDLNCDGAVNAFDIDPFVLALTDPAGYALTYPACSHLLADCNGDGAVNAFDIDPFVNLLTGQ